MKYLIGNRVINADHIVEAVYLPEDGDEKSAVHITLSSTNALELDHCATSERIVLRDKSADCFWDAYTSGAEVIA